MAESARLSQEFIAILETDIGYARVSQQFITIVEDSGEGPSGPPPAIINNPLVMT